MRNPFSSYGRDLSAGGSEVPFSILRKVATGEPLQLLRSSSSSSTISSLESSDGAANHVSWEKKSWIEQLPLELVVHIASFVCDDDLVYFSCVCRYIRAGVLLSNRPLRTRWTSAFSSPSRLLCAHRHGVLAPLPRSMATCRMAVSSGSIPVLQMARELGYPWCEEAAALACYRGDNEIVRWMWERGCAFDADCCSAAARGGHLNTLKLLRLLGNNIFEVNQDL